MLALAGILSDFVWQWPIAFVLGVVVGLALSSRFRIIRRRKDPEEG